MINLAPWYYRDFLLKTSNDVFESISIYKTELLTGNSYWEAVTKLKKNYLPDWYIPSSIYSSNEGSGTSKFKNNAIHKAISEGLERWAFYSTVEDSDNRFGYKQDPSTTGMAAFPETFSNHSRKNAIFEATERWCLHEFWRLHLPVIEHPSKIENLRHFEIISGQKNLKISLLHYEVEGKNIYGFACENNLSNSFQHALVELSRNIYVLKNLKSEVNLQTLTEVYDRRMFFFSKEEGFHLFLEKVNASPKSILIKPKLICDKEIIGPWSKYAKVWRYLYERSNPEEDSDHTFFMF